MIRVLGKDFKIKSTITRYSSITWNLRFRESGSFTLFIPYGSGTILKKNEIIKHKGNYGIVKYIKQTPEGTEYSGHDFKSLLGNRVAEIKNYSGKSETVIKNILSDNTKGKRSFPNFHIAYDDERGNEINWNIVALDSIENNFKSICELEGIGYDMAVRDNQLYFDILIPHEKNVIYAQRYRNIANYEYTLDALNEKNTAAVALKSEGLKIEAVSYTESMSKITVSEGKIYFPDGTEISTEGLEYLKSKSFIWYVLANKERGAFYCEKENYAQIYPEKYICIGSINTLTVSDNDVSGHVGTRYEFMGDSISEGFDRCEVKSDAENWQNDLKSNGETENVTAEILDGSDYKTKWDLGDIVSVRIDVGCERKVLYKQITEVQAAYENGGVKITPVFGECTENTLKKLVKGRL